MSIILNNITIKRNEISILKNISYRITENGVTHLKGTNGIGKTSLLRCIAGYFPPYKGNIDFDDKITKAYLGHENGLKSDLTLNENIRYFLRISNKFKKYQDLVVNNLNLNKILNKQMGSLSFGQKRRSALATILISEWDLLLLDEPTNGMDEISKEGFYNILKEIKKNSIIIITGHHKSDSTIDYIWDLA